MNKRYCLFLLALASVLGSALAEPLPVQVERVLDGDTVVVAGRQDNIRLSNIDAPERGHGQGKTGQPFSTVSAKYLERLLTGTARITMECTDRDTRYGRDVCEFFRDGASVNRQMVAAGMAWANTSARGRYLHDRTLPALQAQARAARLGLWATDTALTPAIPPWEWRDVCWRQGICLVPQNN